MQRGAKNKSKRATDGTGSRTSASKTHAIPTEVVMEEEDEDHDVGTGISGAYGGVDELESPLHALPKIKTGGRKEGSAGQAFREDGKYFNTSEELLKSLRAVGENNDPTFGSKFHDNGLEMMPATSIRRAAVPVLRRSTESLHLNTPTYNEVSCLRVGLERLY